MKVHIENRWITVILIVLSGLFALLRFLALDADPPILFQSYGQALITDPYYYTWFSRNAVLFNNWNLFEYDRYIIFAYTAVSGLSYILFSIIGVSRLVAHLTSILLHFGGLFFYIWTFTKHYSKQRVALLSFLLVSNLILFFYSRYPLLENGLIFFSGITVFLFFRYGNKSWGLFLTGISIACAALLGKLLGLLIFFPIITVLITRKQNKSIGSLMLVSGGLFFGFIIYLAIFFDGSLTYYIDYLKEIQATVIPSKLYSFTSMLTGLFSYWSYQAFIIFISFQLLIAIMGYIIYTFSPNKKTTNDKEEMIFSTVWILVATVILSQQEWRPIRHLIFALMPVAWLGAYFFEKGLIDKFIIKINLPKTKWITIWFTITVMLSIIIASIKFLINNDSTFTIENTLLALTVSIIICLILNFRFKNHTLKLKQKTSNILVAIFFILTIAQSSYFIYKGLRRPQYQMKQLNRDLQELLSENSIITGPFAPALSIDNNLKGIFEFFGPRPGSRHLFKKYNITHICIAPEKWQWIQNYYGLSINSPLIFNKTIRGTPIQLRSINNNNSAFDSLLISFYNDDITTAKNIAERLIAKYPQNLVLKQFNLYIYYMSRDLAGTMNAVNTLGESYPNNYDVQRSCAYMSAKCYWVSKSPQILEKVKYYLNRINRLNPPEIENIDHFLRETKP